MDLLGSIMKSMDKPPAVSNQEKKRRKAEAKLADEEKEKKTKFRITVPNSICKLSHNILGRQLEKQVSDFIKDGARTRLKLEPMEKLYRSIAHDVAEVAGLMSLSFGDEGINRHIMLFKKEHSPSEEELEALREGKEFDPNAQRDVEFDSEEATPSKVSKPSNDSSTPSAANYRDKYKSILGEASGQSAAKVTVPNKTFGFVPSANKQDQRSIEETLKDIRARKRQKGN
ncbi:sperm-associated antigen 7 homolog isoform X1 [Oscarella lobularis]|uniref:sperm-associated antigen 7 homolog isoform X1 n=1 Tax=Oscarella lobularis TaxID=121494 RepID=UPI0033131A5B